MMKRLILLFTVFVCLSACQEGNVIPYTGGSYIYFNKSYGIRSLILALSYWIKRGKSPIAICRVLLIPGQ